MVGFLYKPNAPPKALEHSEMTAHFESGGRSVCVLGDGCDVAQFTPFPNPKWFMTGLTATVGGAPLSMAAYGGAPLSMADFTNIDAAIFATWFRAEGDLARRERECVAEAYMRAHGIVDADGTKKLALCSWLYAVECATRSTSPVVAETGSVTLTARPSFRLRVRPSAEPGAAQLTIESRAVPVQIQKRLVAATIRHIMCAFGEAILGRSVDALDALDLLKEYNVQAVGQYMLSETNCWVNEYNEPIADMDLLTRSFHQENTHQYAELVVCMCPPCMVCGCPIYDTSVMRRCPDTGEIRVPSVEVCNGCSAPALTSRDHRMWGPLVLRQGIQSNSLVPVCAPALPGYMYCGDHRATPWQRMAYISRWARSILARRTRVDRSSALVGDIGHIGHIGHIYSLPSQIVAMILEHLLDSIHPPAHRWIYV